MVLAPNLHRDIITEDDFELSSLISCCLLTNQLKQGFEYLLKHNLLSYGAAQLIQMFFTNHRDSYWDYTLNFSGDLVLLKFQIIAFIHVFMLFELSG